MIEKVGTLAHERLAAAVERIDDDFERFLVELLGNLGASCLQQPRRPRHRRVELAGGEHGFVQAVDRISRPAQDTALAPEIG